VRSQVELMCDSIEDKDEEPQHSFFRAGIQHEHRLSLQHVRCQEIDAFRQCEADPDAEIVFSVFRTSTFRKPSVFRWNSCAVWDKTSPRNASQPSFEEILGMTGFDLQLHLCILCMIAQVGGEFILCFAGMVISSIWHRLTAENFR